MTILRSFLVAQGASQASFTADVEEFLGVTPAPGGAIILTKCRGMPENRPAILGPNGLAFPTRQGDEWHIFMCLDGQEPPTGARYVGGLAGAINGTPTGIYFFARIEVVEHEPIPHVGRQHRPGDNPP